MVASYPGEPVPYSRGREAWWGGTWSPSFLHLRLSPSLPLPKGCGLEL